MSDPKEFLYMARLSEQTERFEDMITYMKKYIENTKDLKDEERNLLSIAYKNAVGSRRTAWRAISAFENKEKTKNSRQIEVIKYYKAKIEKELENYCHELVSLIDQSLFKQSLPVEAKVFYLKMKADYFRYMSEFYISENFKKSSDNAMRSYQQAVEVAEKGLPPTHPIRLGLALNNSVFFYEIKHDAKSAIQIAKKAFEDAINEFETLEEEDQIDSATIMQLLRDNITLWKKEVGEDEKTADK